MQSFSHRTEVKALFLILWFNCESRIEIDREKWIKKFPAHGLKNNVYSNIW